VVDFGQLMCEVLTNPVIYFLLVFGYSIAVAMVLPTPIELPLFVAIAGGSLTLFTAALLAVALGKAVGAWLVFLLGLKVEGAMNRWAQRSKIIKRIMDALERFVRYTGTLGLFTLLSIPFMSDTAVLYFYALFNEEGKSIDRRHFIITNFLAGISRVSLFFILAITLFRDWLQVTPC
jgi:membrane protein DedA with SNARE-associated domain